MRGLAIALLILTFVACSQSESKTPAPESSKGESSQEAPSPAGDHETLPEVPPVAAAADPAQESPEVRCMREAAWAVLKIGRVEITRDQLLADLQSVDTSECPEDFLVLFTRARSFLENRAKKYDGETIPPGAADPEDQAIKPALEAMIEMLRAAGVREIGPTPGSDEPGSQ